jgi:hypothetical protein
MIFKIRAKVDGAHVTANVFAGEEGKTFAVLGVLRFDYREWRYFKELIEEGELNSTIILEDMT